jgi:hypothetical protein
LLPGEGEATDGGGGVGVAAGGAAGSGEALRSDWMVGAFDGGGWPGAAAPAAGLCGGADCCCCWGAAALPAGLASRWSRTEIIAGVGGALEPAEETGDE